MKPTITVLIDTYNHERFIEEAIVSVLEQDFPQAEMEIIVVDDGSTDHTPELIGKFAPRVRHLRKPNGGQASAFNAGIAEARGEIIAFLDGDDWWERNKLARVMEAMTADSSIGIVGHGIVMVDEPERKRTALSPPRTCRFNLLDTDGAQTFRNCMCFLGTSRVVIRRQVACKALPIPEAMIVEADEYLSAVSAAYGDGLVLDECLTYYRLHGRNLYQFGGKDPARIRQKLNSLACLAETLPTRLAETGVGPQAISAVADPIQVEATRMRLTYDGGMPWQTYNVERKAVKLSYHGSPTAYRVYKEISLLLSLALSPRRYYQLRDWYAANGLRRLREIFGEPRPRAQIIERPLATSREGACNESFSGLPRLQ